MRIEIIVDTIEGKYLCDVGCDHGYIPILACKTKKIEKAIAMDVNKQPLEKAKENISKTNYKIDTQLSNGLEKYNGQCDTITICGMGGLLIIKILENSLNKINYEQLILQPQSDFYLFRKFLINNSIKIEKEIYVKEKNKFYIIFSCRKNCEDIKYSEKELYFGKNNSSATYKSYLLHEIEKYKKIINKTTDNEKKLFCKKIIEYGINSIESLG
ncbi:MAG: tRNA (adenine(22)-N(1))-methyltransferase [Lachnospirales bacterium]